jgi:hypothetical protein
MCSDREIERNGSSTKVMERLEGKQEGTSSVVDSFLTYLTTLFQKHMLYIGRPICMLKDDYWKKTRK